MSKLLGVFLFFRGLALFRICLIRMFLSPFCGF